MKNEKVYIGIILILLLTGITLGGLYYLKTVDYNKLDNQLNESKQVLNQTEEDLKVSEDYSEFLEGFGVYMSDQFESLDLLMGEVDESNKSFVNWLVDNSSFYGEDIATGNYLYGVWLGERGSFIDEYDSIIEDLSNTINALEQKVEEFDSGVKA